LQIIKLIRRNNIDLISAHNFAAGFSAGIAAKFCRTPILIMSHNYVSEYKTLSKNKIKIWLNRMREKMVIFIYRLAGHMANEIIAVSNFIKEELVKYGFRGSKINVVYNAIDLNKYNPNLNGSKIKKEFQLDSHLLIGTVGQLEKYKGLPYLISAAKEVVKDIPQVKFLIVGEGGERDNLKEMVNRLALREHIIFAGYRVDIPDILAALDIFVLPSITEGFPHALLEAMAMAKPIIATEAGPFPEMIKNKKIGLLIPVKNSKALAQAIVALLKNIELRQELGMNAFEYAKENFQLKNKIDKLFHIYLTLIKNGSNIRNN
jgi:glycosyltransferase involved in cell wall biosynthesis